MRQLPSDVFAQRLREVRRRAGVSRTDLSRRITLFLGGPIEPTLVQRFEEGTRAPRLDEAVAAADALDISLLDLIEMGDRSRTSESQGVEGES
ncbi:helix-turn-helix domain-containing protein [Glutamicibacter endophyticus]|uniref:helix-turn-helix domain-containing protein n=1 Tax=Glutamicibacter endophyticus TaxID=1522174 RepID=UPI003AF10253